VCVCVCVCVGVCVGVCVWARGRARARTHAARTHARTHAQAHKRAWTCALVRVHMRVCVGVCARTSMQAQHSHKRMFQPTQRTVVVAVPAAEAVDAIAASSTPAKASAAAPPYVTPTGGRTALAIRDFWKSLICHLLRCLMYPG
jgi:hypothetical protein